MSGEGVSICQESELVYVAVCEFHRRYSPRYLNAPTAEMGGACIFVSSI
jgi:hypothetical protein